VNEITEIWGKVKAHPYLAAAGFFAVGAIIIWIVVPATGSAAGTGTGQGTAAADTSSQAAAAQYGASLASAQAAEAVSANQVNGSLQLGQIQADTQQEAIGTSGSIASQSIAAAQTLGLASIAANLTGHTTDVAGAIDVQEIQANAVANQNSLLFGYLNNQLSDQYSLINTIENRSTPAPSGIDANQFDVLQSEIAGLRGSGGSPVYQATVVGGSDGGGF
jgi:hypothetical protein